jgi:hypothetical protein
MASDWKMLSVAADNWCEKAQKTGVAARLERLRKSRTEREVGMYRAGRDILPARFRL